jgi:hypothetical protein
MARPVALRTSLIWHDEVMGDVVSERPEPITVGPGFGATFTTPDLGLDEHFAILRPGRRGHLLALGGRMAGTICIGGVEHDVAAFVASGEGGYRATAIAPGDWGVIELEGSGQHKLFFQFVPLDSVGDAQPFATPKVLAAGAAGYALSAAVLAMLWAGTGVGAGEAMFRGLLIAGIALAMASALRWLLKQDNDSRASLAFSVVVHAAILFTTYELYSPGADAADLGRRDDAARFAVTRVQKPAVAVAVPPDRLQHANEMPASSTVQKPKKLQPTPTLEEWQRHAKSTSPKTPLKPGLTREQQDVLDQLSKPGAGFDAGIKQLGGTPDQPGPETGPLMNGPTTRDDPDGPPGDGPGRRGHPGRPGDRTPPPIDVGPIRAGQMCAGAGCGGGARSLDIDPVKSPTNDGPTLSSDDIERVMGHNKALLRSCYQKRLNRDPALAGGFTAVFVIAPSGEVSDARIVNSDLRDPEVGSCVARNIRKLHFKESGGGANVRYPFVFSH